jgi:hypothetical protein
MRKLFLIFFCTALAVPMFAENAKDWKTYRNKSFGLEIKYPASYFLCPEREQAGARRVDFDYVTLRQNTASAAECRTIGKRIGFYMYRLGGALEFNLSGKTIRLTEETTADDIAERFLKGDNRPAVRRSCDSQDIHGTKAVICRVRAPGEAPGITGGIAEVFALGIFEMENGERILAQMSNDAGGTPHARDRALGRDVVRIFQTLR